ncbi:MAG: trypsin-like peptidase domain-containing protein [Actinobacteria bacterium]|nr:trypsin-like peptidase domain-containing protein [Actinomycetota bacterium]
MRRLTFPPALALVLALAVLLTACSGGVVDQVRGSDGPSVTPTLPTGSAIDPLDTSADPVVLVVEAVRPAVVNVTTDALRDTGVGLQPDQGVGTGFVVRSDGVIVTNCHVVEGASRITVITVPPEQARHEARVIGGDCDADLAVLKIDAEDLPTVPLGSSADLQLGQRVVALGYALALEGGPSVTTGIVSALDRTIQAQDPNFEGGTRTYTDVIQTDAAINPGNSGGPLVDLSGRVIGINTAGAGQAENIGFAIAIDAAKPVIDRAIENPSAPVAYLGVVTQDVDPGLALQFNLPVEEGAYVVEVTPDGPAEAAGIAGGHVIVGFDGEDVTASDQLGELIRDREPGDRVEVVVVVPGGDRETHVVELGVRPGIVP